MQQFKTLPGWHWITPPVTCLLSRLASKRNKLSNPDKSQSPQSWPPDSSVTEKSPGQDWLPVLAAVDVHLASQDRPRALHTHVNHRQLLCFCGVLGHDHIVAYLWDLQSQVQFHLSKSPSRQMWNVLDAFTTDNGKNRAEETPGNSFLCHHSKTYGAISKDVR